MGNDEMVENKIQACEMECAYVVVGAGYSSE